VRTALAAGAAAAIAVGQAGCTLEPGGPFAAVEASLDARFVPEPDRDAGGGWLRLDTDYEVRIEAMTMEVEVIELLDLGGGTTSFDPANPPPGYLFCHNGECHAEDGRIVSYEEVEAELASGVGASTVLTMLPEVELDLVAGQRIELECEPSCELPLARVGLARATVHHLSLSGRVRDGRATPRLPGETAFAGELELPDVQVVGELDLPADREHDPDVTLELALAPGSRLLDGIDFAALPAGDPIDLVAALDPIVDNLAATALEAVVTR
jgi:hypothetical protein